MLLPYASLSLRGETPVSAEYDDIYYSTQSGRAESDYVYLQGNDLPARFATKKRFVVGEIGFGSGLNFFLTAQRFLQHAPANHHLFYVSVEHRPWPLADLQRQHAAWTWFEPALCAPLQSAFYTQYPHNHQGFHLLRLHPRIQLLLLWDEVQSALDGLVAQVDAWYLDGFSPRKNPACWQESVFLALARNSAAGATCASFSAARMVRDGLTAAGFVVEKHAGFAHKREMIRGVCPQPPTPEAHWSLLPQNALAEEHPVAVVGAGVAGVSVARALAESGRQVVLYHDPQSPAASAVPVAAPYVQPDSESALLQAYQLGSYHHAMRFYASTGKAHYQPMPLRQNPCDARQAARYQKRFAQALLNEREWQRHESALCYLRAGVIDAPALLRDLCQHPNISVREQKVTAWREDEQAVWIGDEAYTALVLASAWQVDLLPDAVVRASLRPVRGQGGLFSANLSPLPQEIDSARFTVMPVGQLSEGKALFYSGASFVPNNDDLSFSAQEQAQCQSALQAYLQQHTAQMVQVQAESAFVGIRAATRDYQPLVGALAWEAEVLEKYWKLRHDVNAVPPQNLKPRRVYLHMGLGSKGYTQAWLNAELIGAHLNGLPLPVPRSHLALLSPLRYVIRALARRQL